MVEAPEVLHRRMQDAFNRQSAETASTTLVFGYLYTGYPEDIALANYEKVTAAQVKAVANKYLNRDKLLTTANVAADEDAELFRAMGLPLAAPGGA